MDDQRQLNEPAREEKYRKLCGILEEMGEVIIAFSAGVDSTFLLSVANDVLGKSVLAVTAVSPTYTAEEREKAAEIVESLNVRHRFISSEELSNPEFARNPPERCFHCKTELFTKLRRIADADNVAFVLDASNADDCSDYRPGRMAAKKLGVRSPLVEAGMTKQDIRHLSRRRGLPTWDAPASACLASRFPYGEAITVEKLNRVELAESFLRRLGFLGVRVRSHGDMARIEVDQESISEIATSDLCRQISARLKEIGFAYVTIDLDGYRTGSMNEMLARATAGNRSMSETTDNVQP
jgi:uncharacterized protein